ncbi:MAG: hypothetical protein Q9195_000836 [Heterodermia aff. obscurata]
MPMFPWQRRAVATRQTQQSSSPPLEGGRVTYHSTNTSQSKATFVADAPEGSKHAARLRKIALQNHQPDFTPSVQQEAPKKLADGRNDSRKMLTARGEQNNGRFPSPPIAVAAQPRSQTSSRPLASGPSQQQMQRSFSSASPLAMRQTTQLQRRQSAKPSTTAEVYRYEKDGQIKYHSRAPSSKLTISAPQGSMEARSMDAAAARLRATSVSERDMAAGRIVEVRR